MRTYAASTKPAAGLSWNQLGLAKEEARGLLAQGMPTKVRAVRLRKTPGRVMMLVWTGADGGKQTNVDGMVIGGKMLGATREMVGSVGGEATTLHGNGAVTAGVMAGGKDGAKKIPGNHLWQVHLTAAVKIKQVSAAMDRLRGRHPQQDRHSRI